MKPYEYGLHHEEYRPYQEDAIEWARSGNGFKILSAPTGSGKTAIAKAFAWNRPTIALMKTKSLQQQYNEMYAWETLYGKANYRCMHAMAPRQMTCDDCAFTPVDKYRCPLDDQCGYFVQKDIAVANNYTCLNYAYFMTAKWPRPNTYSGSTGKIPFHTNLVCDEAHGLPDVVTDFAGIEVKQEQLEHWELPRLPVIKNEDYVRDNGLVQVCRAWASNVLDRLETVLSWLESDIKSDPQNEKHIKKYRKIKSFYLKVSATYTALNTPHDWYIMCDEKRLIAKPLTAKYHFKKFFGGFQRALLMSATIGDPKTLAMELGIKEFSSYEMPNQWPPDTRPVFALDVPGMGSGTTKKMNRQNFKFQADAVADVLRQYPDHWTGVLHVTRIKEARLVVERLSDRGYEHRMWLPPATIKGRSVSTEVQLARWQTVKQARRGAIAVAWNWDQGVNLTDSQICGVLKVPFPYLGDPFEKARKRRAPKTYAWRAASRMTQMLGRTRRGEEDDYNLNGEERQIVFIADGDWRNITSYLGSDTLEAIREM